MNCGEFADWLDRGGPEEAPARRHAEQCTACAASLRSAEELERALRTSLAVAPANFTDQVMRRLPAIPEKDARVAGDSESPWPWWIQILFEPSAALGLALGLLYAVAAPSLLGADAPFLPAALERLGAAVSALPTVPWLEGIPGVSAMVAALAVAGFGLFRGSRMFFDHVMRLRAR